MWNVSKVFIALEGSSRSRIRNTGNAGCIGVSCSRPLSLKTCVECYHGIDRFRWKNVWNAIMVLPLKACQGSRIWDTETAVFDRFHCAVDV